MESSFSCHLAQMLSEYPFVSLRKFAENFLSFVLLFFASSLFTLDSNSSNRNRSVVVCIKGNIFKMAQVV